MFNGINSSIMNNFTIVHELSSTPENTKCFSRIKDTTSFDSKFKERPLRSKTSGKLTLSSCWDVCYEQQQHTINSFG